VRARALYLKGDIQARMGNLANALRSFDRLLKVAPHEPYALEAALAAANMAYSARYLSKARTFAMWIVKHAHTGAADTLVGEDGIHRRGNERGNAQDLGHWLLAWNERQSGALPEVMDSYLGQIDPEGPLGEAALYWRARLALDNNEPETALVFADILRTRAPTSYYALAMGDMMKHVVANEAMPIPSLVNYTTAPLGRPAGAARDMAGLMTLVEHGLATEARRLLRQLPTGTLTDEERVAASWIYQQCGEVHLATVLARRSALEPNRSVDDPVMYQLAYPRPYEDQVLHYANVHDVPPHLVFAVMREESGFDPRAQSPRRARGLMQMIRPTAKKLAKEAGIKRFNNRKLFEPEVAIHLGTFYLAQLLNRFDRNLPATIAAYHAGEDRVQRWLRTRSHLSPDEFIEDIPYSSTRGYVKKVMSAYGLYRLLYDNNRDTAFGDLFRPKHQRWRGRVPRGGELAQNESPFVTGQ
jgi:soluble lytic murein transglycosylase